MKRVYLCEQCGYEDERPPYDAGWFTCRRCGGMVVVRHTDEPREEAKRI